MTLIQNEPKHIYYGEPIIVSDMQGPCPDGFHVPLHSEWATLAQMLSTLGIANGIYGKLYLKMPYAGFRNYYTSNVQHLNEDGYYISSSSLTSEYMFFLKTEDASFSDNNGTQIGTGCSIRPFANTPVTPDSSWTALYSDKIYHNSDLGLISISSDGNTRLTIADKNLGATTVYNSGDTLSEANCGKYYQRGNNYGFAFTGTVTTSSTQVNASTYGPGNYYESSTFITTNPRDNSGNLNLRGGVSQGTSEEATEIKAVYLGETKVRPAYKPRTFTITRTEKSDMSSGWTYSDDAAGLTAGDGAFDDFFGYSAVLLNTSGVETAEMTQSGGVFTGAMTTLGNITSGDNVMIKFPVRGIKMSKSGSTVTLSITDGLGRESEGYQYYAHSTGTLSNPGTPKDAFYLGAYMGCNTSSVLMSLSGQSPAGNLSIAYLCTCAKNNGNGYNIMGFYQRQYIAALYMMKYGNPNSQSVVGTGVAGGTYGVTTGGTDSQTNATYGSSSSSDHVRLFGLEDRWGNKFERTGGVCTDGNRIMYAALSGWDGTVNTSSPYESTGATVAGNGCISSIDATNKGMFIPIGYVSNSSYNTYYCDFTAKGTSSLPLYGGSNGGNNAIGIYYQTFYPPTYWDNPLGTRLMYMNGLT